MAFSKTRRLLLRIAIIVLGLFGLVALSPFILSSSWVYEPIVESFAKDKFDLKIGRIALSWFKPIAIESVTLSDISDNTDLKVSRPLLTIESIVTDRSLLAYLFNQKQLGKITIKEPVVDIALLENESNLQRVVDAIRRSTAADKTVSSDQKRAPIDVDVSVIDLSIQVARSGDEKPLIVVPSFDAELSYRASGNEPILEVGPTQILQETELTQELVRLGLGQAVPLLAKSAWFDGRVSLSTGPIVVPLDHPIDSHGSASLIMHEVRTGPNEPLVVDAIAFLSTLRDQEISAELIFVNNSRIELEIKDKRVTHAGLEAGLPMLDQRLQVTSNGSVSLQDKSLNLLIKVPVPVEQFAQRDKVKELGVPMLSLPIRGTIEKPELDWTAFRKDSGLVLSLMASQLQSDAPVLSGVVGALGGVAEGKADEAIEAAAQLVQEIRERRKKKAEANAASAQNDSSNAASEDESKPSRRPILDAIRRTIRQP